ncbi:MAG: PorV/PorQ family protein [candidate division Zixibacteria bacterium]|nr:PorV/PorQ family protein [candidate division Zixibacteria bacterium]
MQKIETRSAGRGRGFVGKLLMGGMLATALLLTAGSDSALGQAKVGTTGAQFLEIGVSPRAMGMGEAYAAVVNDISAVYYNPAGLTSLMGPEAMASYIKMPADINYFFGAFGLPVESVGGVLGFAAYSLNSGKMTETTYGHGLGTGREFTAQHFAMTAGYARYLTDRFSIGLTLRYIGMYYLDMTANGWSADVGTMYDSGYRGFKLAMVISNFGPDLKFVRKPAPLPINFRFGGAINLIEKGDHFLTFAAEGAHPSDNLEKYNAGLEYAYKNMLVLRVGERLNYDVDGLTFGAGLRIPFGKQGEMKFDYSYQDFGILTNVPRFSVGVAF